MKRCAERFGYEVSEISPNYAEYSNDVLTSELIQYAREDVEMLVFIAQCRRDNESAVHQFGAL